jgi:hypothetical protein
VLFRSRDAAIGTAQAAGDAGLRAEYLALLEQERGLLRQARPAPEPAEADELGRAEALAGRLDLVDAGAERLKAQFAGVGQLHAVEVNRRIAAERASLQLQQEQLASVSGDSRNLLGRVALRSFAAVRAQLYRLVLKADVGLLDVAWTQKRERVESIQQLSQQKDAALQALDRDLRQVLQEVE